MALPWRSLAWALLPGNVVLALLMLQAHLRGVSILGAQPEAIVVYRHIFHTDGEAVWRRNSAQGEPELRADRRRMSGALRALEVDEVVSERKAQHLIEETNFEMLSLSSDDPEIDLPTPPPSSESGESEEDKAVAAAAAEDGPEEEEVEETGDEEEDVFEDELEASEARDAEDERSQQLQAQEADETETETETESEEEEEEEETVETADAQSNGLGEDEDEEREGPVDGDDEEGDGQSGKQSAGEEGDLEDEEGDDDDDDDNDEDDEEEEEEVSGYDDDGNSPAEYLKLPVQVKPKHKHTFSNFRTSTCSYLCDQLKSDGWKPATKGPAMLLIRWYSYDRYKLLKHTIVNHIGAGAACIGGGKGAQLRCRKGYARRFGCAYNALGVQPRQWNLHSSAECKAFFKHADREEAEGQAWLRKPGGTSHGNAKAATVHYGTSSLKSYRSCKKKREGLIMQELVRNPLLLNGKRFTLRTFMLVASTEPFLVFYHHGVVRVADKQFDGKSSKVSAGATHDALPFAAIEPLLRSSPAFESEGFLEGRFKRHAFAVYELLLHSAPVDRRRGRFQLFSTDWMLDQDGAVHLIEANGDPSMVSYPGLSLTPAIWTNMFRLVENVHTNPAQLKMPLTAGVPFEVDGWELVYNEAAEQATPYQSFNPCTAPLDSRPPADETMLAEDAGDEAAMQDDLAAETDPRLDAAQTTAAGAGVDDGADAEIAGGDGGGGGGGGGDDDGDDDASAREATDLSEDFEDDSLSSPPPPPGEETNALHADHAVEKERDVEENPEAGNDHQAEDDAPLAEAR